MKRTTKHLLLILSMAFICQSPLLGLDDEDNNPPTPMHMEEIEAITEEPVNVSLSDEFDQQLQQLGGDHVRAQDAFPTTIDRLLHCALAIYRAETANLDPEQYGEEMQRSAIALELRIRLVLERLGAVFLCQPFVWSVIFNALELNLDEYRPQDNCAIWTITPSHLFSMATTWMTSRTLSQKNSNQAPLSLAALLAIIWKSQFATCKSTFNNEAIQDTFDHLIKKALQRPNSERFFIRPLNLNVNADRATLNFQAALNKEFINQIKTDPDPQKIKLLAQMGPNLNARIGIQSTLGYLLLQRSQKISLTETDSLIWEKMFETMIANNAQLNNNELYPEYWLNFINEIIEKVTRNQCQPKSARKG
jgi:hypothetical protein